VRGTSRAILVAVDRNVRSRNVKIGILLFGSVLLALSGCATSYQPYNIVTGGLTETKLGPDLVRIVFHGNSSTSKERAQDFALLRAADLSLQAGFPYFTIQNEKSDVVRDSSGGLPVMPTDEILVQFTKDKVSGVLTYDSEFLVHTLRVKYDIK
jgi:hypothetical protein